MQGQRGGKTLINTLAMQADSDAGAYDPAWWRTSGRGLWFRNACFDWDQPHRDRAHLSGDRAGFRADTENVRPARVECLFDISAASHCLVHAIDKGDECCVRSAGLKRPAEQGVGLRVGNGESLEGFLWT